MNDELDYLFDENGDLSEAIHEKMRQQGFLKGIEASAWLAEEFAGETHGNYKAETLFRRSGVDEYYNVRIENKKQFPARPAQKEQE